MWPAADDVGRLIAQSVQSGVNGILSCGDNVVLVGVCTAVPVRQLAARLTQQSHDLSLLLPVLPLEPLLQRHSSIALESSCTMATTIIVTFKWQCSYTPTLHSIGVGAA